MASQFKQQALDIGKESTWGTLASAFTRMVNVLDVSFKPTNEVLEKDVLNLNLTRTAHEIGRKGATLAFKWLIAGGDTTNPSAGDTAAAPELDVILDAVFTKTAGKSRTYSSGGGAGTNTVTVAAPAAGDFLVGGRMVSVQTGESRIVTAYDSGTGVITVDRNFVTSITTGVISSSMVYTRKDSAPAGISARFELDGTEYRATGGRVTSLKIPALKAGQFPVLEVAIEFDSYDETAFTPETAGTWPSRPVVKGGSMAIGGTQYDVQDLEFDFAPDIPFVEAVDGAEGRAGIELVGWGATGAFAIEEAKDAHADWLAGTELANLAFTSGNAFAGWGLWVSDLQFTAFDHVSVNGYRMDKVSFASNDNGAVSNFALSTGA